MAKRTNRVGGGGRFKKLERKIESRGYSKSRAKAAAAAIGRRKYGKRKFQRMASAGRKRHARG